VSARALFAIALSLAATTMMTIAQESNLQPQDQASNLIGVSLGVIDFHQQDKYMTPLVVSGTMPAVYASFELRLLENRHMFNGSFGVASMNPDEHPRDVTVHAGSLTYTFLHHIGCAELDGQSVQYFVGGGLSSFVTNTDFDSFDWTRSYQSFDQTWYWSHSLDLVVRGETKSATLGAIAVQLRAPILALVSRPANGHWLSNENTKVGNHFLNAATRGTLQYLWDDLVLSTDIEYSKSLGGQLELRGVYRFDYVSSSRPDPTLSMKMYLNTFVMGVVWRF